jgi:hypothetical protein
MSDYKEIKGIKVQDLGADPPAPFVGQIWYNNSSGDLKYFGIQSAAWSTGGNLTTARRSLAGAGTQTAGLAFGGRAPPPAVGLTATEEYNGSTWTAGGALGTGRYGLAGCGTQTAGLAFGGDPGVFTDATEEYNGSAWTAGGNLTTARALLGGAGTQTAGLAFGGFDSTFPTLLNATE